MVRRCTPMIKLYLAGDSTMAKKLSTERPETGWGEFLESAFDVNHVYIENVAQNGRSMRTFISDELWSQIVDQLQPGDYVFIQFGHNDQSGEKPDRYTSPVEYRANLVRMVHDVRACKATPIVLTPVVRRNFDEQGNFVDLHPTAYSVAVRTAAVAENVSLIDMQYASGGILKEYGDADSLKLFLHLKAGECPNYPQASKTTRTSIPQARKLCVLWRSKAYDCSTCRFRNT